MLSIVIVIPATASRLPHRRFTRADGLPSDQVGVLFFDQRGFLWVGTSEGAARFDGSGFSLYGGAEGEAWGAIRGIGEGPDGSLWIAGAAELHLHRRGLIGGFRSIGRDEGGWEGTILDIAIDDAGITWLATTAGLFRSMGPGRSVFRRPEGLEISGPIHVLAVDADGLIWAGGEDGAFRIREAGVDHLAKGDGLGSDSVRAILPLSTGKTWVGTTEGLCSVDTTGVPGGPLRCEPAGRQPAAREWVMALASGRNGTEFVATNRSLYEWSPRADRLLPLDPEGSLGRAEILALARDEAGDLWIGTSGGGLLRVARNGLTSFSRTDGLLATRIAAVSWSAADGLVAVSTGHYFHHFRDGRFEGYVPRLPPEVDYLGWAWDEMWTRDDEGRSWLATGRGLAVFPPGSGVAGEGRRAPERLLTQRDGLAGSNIHRVHRDSSGSIWIGTVDDPECTLTRYELRSGKIERFCIDRGLPRDASPTSFAEDPQGRLWIAFFNGRLMRWVDGEFETVRLGRIHVGALYALHFDASGRLWIGTGGAGVLLLPKPEEEEPQVVIPFDAAGPIASEVRCICEDHDGRLYAGTAAGIIRLDLARGRRREFAIADGLPNSFVDVCAVDGSGDLWFGTFDGIVRLHPEPDRPLPRPRVFISSLVAGGTPVRLADLLVRRVPSQVFPPSRQEVEIRFSGPGFGTGGELRYQYRLHAADAWSAPRREKSVLLRGLPPGKYRFAVRAVNADGVASDSPAEVEFTILAPLWRRGWVLGLSALVLLAAIVSAHRLRVARVLALERQRTRIAMDLHDEIGAGLGGLTLLSDLVAEQAEETPPVAGLISEIGDAAAELSTALDDIVGGLRPGADTLESLAGGLAERARTLFSGRGARLITRFPELWPSTRLGLVARRDVFLIGLEALHNAASHAQARTVLLAFDRCGRRWRLTVRDDGRGMAGSDPCRPGGGNGLEGMRRRAREIGARLEITSQPGEGTTVCLIFRLRSRRGVSRWFRTPDDHMGDGGRN